MLSILMGTMVSFLAFFLGRFLGLKADQSGGSMSSSRVNWGTYCSPLARVMGTILSGKVVGGEGGGGGDGVGDNREGVVESTNSWWQ